MKIKVITLDDQSFDATLPYDGAAFVTIERCPLCGVADCNVVGRETTHTHDVYQAEAKALCCEKRIGRIEVKVDTVFGIEEDERVLGGPWRVY